jgi:hypothetical protein
MDALEKFLYDITYKFPKGYPDVLSGELKKTRIINKVYTTLSPLLSE